MRDYYPARELPWEVIINSLPILNHHPRQPQRLTPTSTLPTTSYHHHHLHHYHHLKSSIPWCHLCHHYSRLHC